MVVATVVSLIISTLIVLMAKWIIKIALNLTTDIALGIMEPSTFTFKFSEMTEKLLPAIENVNITSIFKTFGWVTLILCLLVAIFKSITAPIRGTNSRNPAQYLASGVISILLMITLFGVGNTNGLLDTVGGWANQGLTMIVGTNGERLHSKIEQITTEVEKSFEEGEATQNQETYGNDANGNAFTNNNLIKLIFAVAIATATVGAAITYVERYLSFAIFMLFGPICVGFGATNETKGTFSDWASGILSQVITIALSMLLWMLFFHSLVQPWTLFNMALSLSYVVIIKNSEKFCNALGFKTMVNGEAGRSLIGAAATTAMGIGLVGRTVGNLANAGVGAASAIKSRKQDQIKYASAVSRARATGNKQAENLAKEQYKKGGFFRGNTEKPLDKYLGKGQGAEQAINNAYAKSYYNSAMGAKNMQDFNKIASSTNELTSKGTGTYKGKEMHNMLNSEAGKGGFTDAQRQAIKQNLDGAYEKAVRNANGNEKLIAQAGEDYKNNYRQFNGVSESFSGKDENGKAKDYSYVRPYTDAEANNIALPHVASGETFKNSNGSYGMSVSDHLGQANRSADLFNQTLHQDAYAFRAESGVATEALGLDNQGMRDMGSLSANVRNGEASYQSALMSIQSDDGSMQKYALMPSDIDISSRATVQVNDDTMKDALFQLRPEDAIAIGDGSMVLVPVGEEPINSDKEEAWVAAGVIDEAIFSDNYRNESSQDDKNKVIRESETNISDAFNNYPVDVNYEMERLDAYAEKIATTNDIESNPEDYFSEQLEKADNRKIRTWYDK